MQKQLSRGQQTGRVAFLGVAFMVMFMAFNSLQSIVSKIYNDYGYQHLGEVSVLLIYFTFGATTLIAPFMIRKLGYKKVMFISSLGYAIYQGAGLVIALVQDFPMILGWVIVLAGAMCCGASASMIWIAQGSYVSQVAGQARKTELFGVFWALMTSSQIFGNLITTFVLGLIGTTAYFLVLTVLGVGSAFLFLLLPDIKQKEEEQLVLAVQVKKTTTIIRDPKYRFLLVYYFFPGIAVGFYATFLYKLIGLAIKQNTGEEAQDYNQRLNFYSGLVFISLGFSQALTGFIASRVGQRFCKFKQAVFASLMVEVAGFVSLLCFFLENYGLCFLVAFLWGSSETFLQTNIGALTGFIFPGKVQAFSVYRIIFALGVTITIVLNILLAKQPAWIFLTIVMTVQVIVAFVSNQLIDIKPKSPTLQQSLVDQVSE